MFKIEKYYALILCLLFVSCFNKEKGGNVINIDIGSTRDVSNIQYTLEKWNIVPLETTSESIIGSVERIEYYQDKFFILDAIHAKTLFVFSKTGKFLGKTKQGKGPGEMINPFAFCIDKTKNHLIIWDQTLNTLFTFDLELNLISEKRLEVFITDIKKVDGKYLIHSQNPEKEAYTFNLFSEDFEQLQASFDFPYKSEGGMYLYRSINVSNHNLLITPNDYSIYQFDGTDIKPLHRINFGSKSFDQHMFDKAGVSEIWGMIRNSKKVSYPLDVFESKRFLGFQVVYGRDPYTYLIANSDGSILSINDMISSSALPKCKIKGSTGSDDDTFYGLVDPGDLINYLEKGVDGDGLNISKPSLDDNPAMMFLSIK
jgi:hypothetical protein